MGIKLQICIEKHLLKVKGTHLLTKSTRKLMGGGCRLHLQISNKLSKTTGKQLEVAWWVAVRSSNAGALLSVAVAGWQCTWQRFGSYMLGVSWYCVQEIGEVERIDSDFVFLLLFILFFYLFLVQNAQLPSLTKNLNSFISQTQYKWLSSWAVICANCFLQPYHPILNSSFTN